GRAARCLRLDRHALSLPTRAAEPVRCPFARSSYRPKRNALVGVPASVGCSPTITGVPATRSPEATSVLVSSSSPVTISTATGLSLERIQMRACLPLGRAALVAADEDRGGCALPSFTPSPRGVNSSA